MNRLQKGLVGIILPGLMAVSGCGKSLIGSCEPVNLSKSHYTEDIKKKADELAESSSLKDIEGAMKGYGSVDCLEKMDEMVRKVIKQDIERGMIYSELGDKFYEMHKK